MTTTPKVLAADAQLPSSVGTAYTSPAEGKGTWIDKFTLCNTTGTTRQVTVYVVPSAGSPSASNTVLSAFAVAAGETYLCPELTGRFLAPGSSVQWFASAATAITGYIGGREVA